MLYEVITIYSTQLVPYGGATKFNYIQTGGELHFNNQPDNPWNNPTFQLAETTLGFDMTGGQITFSDANNYWAGDFRNGITLEIDNSVFQIIEFQHVKPGKGAAFVRTKLKNIKSGGVVEKTFRPTDKYPQAHIERSDMQYLVITSYSIHYTKLYDHGIILVHLVGILPEIQRSFPFRAGQVDEFLRIFMGKLELCFQRIDHMGHFFSGTLLINVGSFKQQDVV